MLPAAKRRCQWEREDAFPEAAEPQERNPEPKACGSVTPVPSSLAEALQVAGLQRCAPAQADQNLTLASVLRAGLESMGIVVTDVPAANTVQPTASSQPITVPSVAVVKEEASPWQDIQPELLEAILVRGGPDITAIACTVCRHWRNIGSSSWLWRLYCRDAQKVRFPSLSWKQTYPLKDATQMVVDKQYSMAIENPQRAHLGPNWAQMLQTEHAIVINRNSYVKAHASGLKSGTDEVKEVALTHLQYLFGANARMWRKRTARVLLEQDIVPLLVSLTHARTPTRIVVNAVRLLYDITLCDPIRLGTPGAAAHFPSIAPALVEVLSRIAAGDGMLGFATCVRLCILGTFSHLMKFGSTSSLQLKNQLALVQANGLQHVVAHLHDQIPRTAAYAGKTLKYLSRTQYGNSALAAFSGGGRKRKKLLHFANTIIEHYKGGTQGSVQQQWPPAWPPHLWPQNLPTYNQPPQPAPPNPANPLPAPQLHLNARPDEDRAGAPLDAAADNARPAELAAPRPAELAAPAGPAVAPHYAVFRPAGPARDLLAPAGMRAGHAAMPAPGPRAAVALQLPHDRHLADAHAPAPEGQAAPQPHAVLAAEPPGQRPPVGAGTPHAVIGPNSSPDLMRPEGMPGRAQAVPGLLGRGGEAMLYGVQGRGGAGAGLGAPGPAHSGAAAGHPPAPALLPGDHTDDAWPPSRERAGSEGAPRPQHRSAPVHARDFQPNSRAVLAGWQAAQGGGQQAAGGQRRAQGRGPLGAPARPATLLPPGPAPRPHLPAPAPPAHPQASSWLHAPSFQPLPPGPHHRAMYDIPSRLAMLEAHMQQALGAERGPASPAPPPPAARLDLDRHRYTHTHLTDHDNPPLLTTALPPSPEDAAPPSPEHPASPAPRAPPRSPAPHSPAHAACDLQTHSVGSVGARLSAGDSQHPEEEISSGHCRPSPGQGCSQEAAAAGGEPRSGRAEARAQGCAGVVDAAPAHRNGGGAAASAAATHGGGAGPPSEDGAGPAAGALPAGARSPSHSAMACMEMLERRPRARTGSGSREGAEGSPQAASPLRPLPSDLRRRLGPAREPEPRHGLPAHRAPQPFATDTPDLPNHLHQEPSDGLGSLGEASI